MLNEKEAFKVGFLMRCAEEGLTMQETHQRIKLALASNIMLVKEAIPWYLQPFTYAGGKAMDLATAGVKTIPSILSYGAAAGLVAPIAAGAGIGYGAAKFTTPDHAIIDEAKQDEVIGEYERLAEEARRRAKIKRIQQQTGRRIVALNPGSVE